MGRREHHPLDHPGSHGGREGCGKRGGVEGEGRREGEAGLGADGAGVDVVGDPAGLPRREPAVPSLQHLGQLGAAAVVGAGDEVARQTLLDPVTHAGLEVLGLVDGHAEGVSQVVPVEALAEVEVEQGAVPQRQVGDRLPHQAGQVDPVRVVVRERRLPVGAGGGPGPQGRVPTGDGKEPDGQAVLLLQAVQPLAGLEERGLDYLERNDPVAEQGQGQVVDAGGVAVEDGREGRRVPIARRPDQLSVVHER